MESLLLRRGARLIAGPGQLGLPVLLHQPGIRGLAAAGSGPGTVLRSRKNRHRPIPEQHAELVAKMRGHYAYFGITGNIRRLSWYAYQVRRIWQKWLSRRGSRFSWDRYVDLLKRHPLPAPRIVHRYTAVSEALP